MASQFSSQFRLSITRALRDQLAEALEPLTPAPLTATNLALLDEQAAVERLASKSGVYELYRYGELVYVGKADGALADRLGNHLRKISGRKNISIDEIGFRCLYVTEDLTAVAPEKLLIKKYRSGGKIPWNTNGFGNKDPGQNRDTTKLKPNHFDVLFPIDLDFLVEHLHPGMHSLSDVLLWAKGALPYNFRFDTDPAFEKLPVLVPSGAFAADDLFRLLAKHLPATWQISALMGYAIMYNDDLKKYPSALRYYRQYTVIDQEPIFKPVNAAVEEADEDE